MKKNKKKYNTVGRTFLHNACYYASIYQLLDFLRYAGCRIGNFQSIDSFLDRCHKLGVQVKHTRHNSYSCGIECCGYADTISMSQQTMLNIIDALPKKKASKLEYRFF